MKKGRQTRKRPKISMRLFFALFIVIELILIDLFGSFIITLLTKYVPFLRRVPKSVWMILISIILGSAITTFLVKFFFDPIVKLGDALGKVAEGDFDVRLSTRHVFSEIRQINQDFNLMTKELGSIEILKTEFVSDVSHEFKTPINAIEGYATLLQGADRLDPEEQAVYVDKILFNTKRLSNLVGNILLLSKVDNQKIQTNVMQFRLDEQIRQSIVALEPKWSQKNVEFDVNLDRVEYTGNGNLLVHVWNNLIENAIKYGPDGGLISMKLTCEADDIIFTIADEGPGIPEEAKQHIFDRFYQVDSSRKTEGNGLGLALVKQILALSNGTISVENLPDKGCKFTVKLCRDGI